MEEVHDLHVWSLTPGIPLLCAHITLSQEADATAVLHALTAHCRGIGIDHSTIQVRGPAPAGWLQHLPLPLGGAAVRPPCLLPPPAPPPRTCLRALLPPSLPVLPDS